MKKSSAQFFFPAAVIYFRSQRRNIPTGPPPFPSLQGTVQERAELCFRVYDSDGSGFLDVSEVRMGHYLGLYFYYLIVRVRKVRLIEVDKEQ